MKQQAHLAIDLGASSGRVMAGLFDGNKLTLEEVHRFPNGGHRIGDHFYWDFVGLFAEIKTGLGKAAPTYGNRVVSAGVHTWGVDYGLVDGGGYLLGLPHQYRDPRTEGMDARAFRRVARRRIYEITGIQFMYFNTMNQLMADAARRSPALAQARRILFTPDLINYWLTGRQTNEYTIASTSQLLDARTRGWAKGLIRRLGLPAKLFGPLVQPGTVVGELQESVREETGLAKLTVIAPGCHYTASAVAAVPTDQDYFIYLSSGTWSLMGVETPKPVITEASYRYGFTNEGGVCGTIRLLKNICGLWLVQECRRIWTQHGQSLDFATLNKQAAAAKPFAAFLDPDYPEFATPGDMPARIAAFCKRTGQTAPATPGATVRMILESLALRYREVFAQLEEMTGQRYPVLHLVGGGVQNQLLNQITADALQRDVLAGPVEATALGNVLMQLLALGKVPDLKSARALIRKSFAPKRYTPRAAAGWDEAYLRFKEIKAAAARAR